MTFEGYTNQATHFLPLREVGLDLCIVPAGVPHGTVAGRRGPNFPPERTSTMCAHNPPCPTAMAPDREAARPRAQRPDQGWSLLCNGVLFFEDTGELLPDGRVVAPHRPLALPVGSAA